MIDRMIMLKNIVLEIIGRVIEKNFWIGFVLLSDVIL